MARHRSKKRQTKLAFSPGSPQAKYANVTYEGSPAKKRKIGQQRLEDVFRSDGPSSSAVAAAGAPPTPLRSSQHTAAQERAYSVDEEERETWKATGQALTESDSDDGVAKFRSKRSKAPPSTNIFTRAPIISPKVKKTSSPDRTKRSSKKKRADKIDEVDSGAERVKHELESDVETQQVASKRSRKQPLEAHNSDDESNACNDDDSDSEVMPVTPLRRNARNSIQHDTDDEDEDIIRPSTQRTPIKPETVSDGTSEDAEDIPKPRAKRRLQSKADMNQEARDSDTAVEQDNGSEEEDVPDSALLGRTRRNRRTLSEEAEAQELAEDAKDLKRSTVFKKHQGGRLRDRTGNSKANDRRSKLEQLKAQREGRTIEISENEDEDDPEDDEEAAAAAGLGNESEEENSWIDDDDDENAPTGEDGDEDETMLGLEMLRHGRRDLKEHFIYVIRWMINSKFNAAGTQELSDLYRMSVQRVNEKAEGLTAQLVSSSWVPNFIYALKARPDYEESALPRDIISLGHDRCSACNRSGHPPSFVVRLKGKAYDRRTLEPLKDGDSSSSSEADSDSEASEDDAGHKLVDTDREWHLGVFCRANAMNAHSLVHWQMHLRQWLLAYLEHQGYLAHDQIVRRERWSTRKRARFVERVMDELEAGRNVKALWGDFKAKLAAVPESTGQRYGR